MNVAIIPARAGSKRIPKKNIKKFQGMPIFYWPLIAAKKTNLFDKIILSTDSKSIAKIGKKYNMDVPFLRPKNISGDHASTSSVISHAIRWLRNNNVNPKFICCIYPTAAYLNPKDLITGYKKIKKKIGIMFFQAGGLIQQYLDLLRKIDLTDLKCYFLSIIKKGHKIFLIHIMTLDNFIGVDLSLVERKTNFCKKFYNCRNTNLEST